MDRYENLAKYNIAETCCASVSIDELRSLSENKDRAVFDTSKMLTYGAIRGSDELRGHLARLYSARAPSPLSPEKILITTGAIQANYLCAYTLVSPGDHVICHYPTCRLANLSATEARTHMMPDQSLYEVPKQLGAEVDLWHTRPENGWLPDIEELKSLIKPNTKLIVLK
jgi:aspartate/methionine/tyrosine aminotransferase